MGFSSMENHDPARRPQAGNWWRTTGITMRPGQWDETLADAYQAGFALIEADDKFRAPQWVFRPV